jgi:hypothetical protein
MPSRKQRRRRQKTFRHEYGFVTYDEEGNEVEVDASEVREKKPEKVKQAPARSQQRGRAVREVSPPSWNRALRRGGMGGLMLVVVIFFFKGMPIAARVAWGVLYAVAFIPLTYWIDRTAYRSYLKRSRKAPDAGARKG